MIRDVSSLVRSGALDGLSWRFKAVPGTRLQRGEVGEAAGTFKDGRYDAGSSGTFAAISDLAPALGLPKRNHAWASAFLCRSSA